MQPANKIASIHSPLPNLDDVEEELMNTRSALRGFSFKSPKSVQQKFNFTRETPKKIGITPSRMSIISEEVSSNDTFLENELNCMDEVGGVIEVLENILKSEEQAFAHQAKVHEENTNKIRLLIHSLKSRTEKENVGGSLLRTPQPQKKDNLRKKAVMNNVDATLQTPRTRGAFNLYNSLRATNPVLNTPKLKQLNEESPGKLLSNALMKQCLLLQETPKKK